MKINLVAIQRIALVPLILTLAGCAHLSFKGYSSSANLNQTKPAQHVALLLPLNGELGYAGQAVRDGVLAAYYEAKQQQQATPTINFYNTHAANTDVVTLYQKAVAEGADVVIGPLDKSNVAALANSNTTRVLTISLNELPAGKTAPTNFLQFSLSQLDETRQVAKQALREGKRRALMIVPAGEWGQQISQVFSQTWQAQGGTIVDRMTLQTGQNVNTAMQLLLQIQYVPVELSHPIHGKKTRLVPKGRQDADMVFMALTPDLARQIKPLLQFYYAGDLTVYATSLVLGDTPTPNEALDMQDVIICDMPWVVSQMQAGIRPNQKNRLYALGMDAYQLSQNPSQLKSTMGMTAKTGTLHLEANNTISRQLMCVTYNQMRQQPQVAESTAILAATKPAEKPVDERDNYLAF